MHKPSADRATGSICRRINLASILSVISVFVRVLFNVSMWQGVIADNLPLQLLPLGLQDLHL